MKKLTILIIILLLIGAYMITKSYNLDLNNKTDQKTFIKVFSTWISNLFSNIKQITMHVIKLDWLPETNNTKND